MRTLVFDTETTGFPKRIGTPISQQPYVVQLAATLYDKGECVSEFDVLVIPEHEGDYVPINPDTIEFHGITDEMMKSQGIPCHEALGLFHAMLDQCDRIVAHNIDFDHQMMVITYMRANAGSERFDLSKYMQRSRVCTMKSLTNVLKIPGKYGYKWPSLDEAYRALVNKDGFSNAHNARCDTKACWEVLVAGEARGIGFK